MLHTVCLCPCGIIDEHCTAVITGVYVEMSVWLSYVCWNSGLTTILLNRSQYLFLFFFMEYSSFLIRWDIFHGSAAAPDIPVDAKEILKLKNKALKEKLQFFWYCKEAADITVHVNTMNNGSVVFHGPLPCGNGHRVASFLPVYCDGCSASKQADVISAFSRAWNLTTVTWSSKPLHWLKLLFCLIKYSSFSDNWELCSPGKTNGSLWSLWSLFNCRRCTVQGRWPLDGKAAHGLCQNKSHCRRFKSKYFLQLLKWKMLGGFLICIKGCPLDFLEGVKHSKKWNAALCFHWCNLLWH